MFCIYICICILTYIIYTMYVYIVSHHSLLLQHHSTNLASLEGPSKAKILVEYDVYVRVPAKHSEQPAAVQPGGLVRPMTICFHLQRSAVNWYPPNQPLE